jgi:hypothetical protein
MKNVQLTGCAAHYGNDTPFISLPHCTDGCGAPRHLYNPGAAFSWRSGFVALDATSHSFNGASSTIG